MIINKKDKIAVLGLGMEGKDVVNSLIKEGYTDITILDRKEKKDLDLKGIDVSKVKFITGDNYLKLGLLEYKIIFRSPGFYRYLPEIVKAEEQGSRITSNIKLFFEKFKGLTIGVTGTKGKGTTSTLIYEILRQESKNVFLAGNIGSPPLSILNKTSSKTIVVLELSSFQLIDSIKSPNIAVVLNITSDHMDWHKDRNEYLNAKKNIIKYQSNYDSKVLNCDYETPKSFADLSPSKTYYFSKINEISGVYVEDGIIYSNIDGKRFNIGKTNMLLLRGVHNWENVCAAICASILAGAAIKDVKKAVFTFKGLEHRLELVADVKGIKYYNDSFSTNPQTTIAAVNSFTEPITLILGGYDKGLDFEEMVKLLCKKRNLENIILIGEVEGSLYELLRKYKFRNLIVKMGKPNMSEIVDKCKKLTKRYGVVLLSPGCASFDMFKDYKDRGAKYKKEIEMLKH
jgi:UDP-N-acetylmuramoylalanine--D-glutamate ligase